MKTALTAGLSSEVKKQLEDDFKSCPLLRERLTALLTKRIDAARTKAISEDLYASPSWAYQQADVVGYERGLKEVISLLSSKND